MIVRHDNLKKCTFPNKFSLLFETGKHIQDLRIFNISFLGEVILLGDKQYNSKLPVDFAAL